MVVSGMHWFLHILGLCCLAGAVLVEGISFAGIVLFGVSRHVMAESNTVVLVIEVLSTVYASFYLGYLFVCFLKRRS